MFSPSQQMLNGVIMGTELRGLIHVLLELESVQDLLLDAHELGPAAHRNRVPLVALRAVLVAADSALAVRYSLQDQPLLPLGVSRHAQGAGVQVNGLAKSPKELGILT